MLRLAPRVAKSTPGLQKATPGPPKTTNMGGSLNMFGENIGGTVPKKGEHSVLFLSMYYKNYTLIQEVIFLSWYADISLIIYYIISNI